MVFYLREESDYVNQKQDVVAEEGIDAIDAMLIWKNFLIILFRMKENEEFEKKFKKNHNCAHKHLMILT